MAIIRVYVKPRSKRNRVWAEDGQLVFETTEKPVGGRVNRSLLKWVSRAFGVELRRVSIVAGHASRSKVVRIDGVDQEAVEEILSKLKKVG